MLHTDVTQLDIYRPFDVVKPHYDCIYQVDVLTIHSVCLCRDLSVYFLLSFRHGLLCFYNRFLRSVVSVSLLCLRVNGVLHKRG
jgi:hypothetical protein